MKVLVTGASGFVGAGLVRALVARGDDVHCLVRPTSNIWRLEGVSNITKHEGDFLDPALLELFKHIRPEVIFHLGSYGTYPKQQTESQKILEGTLLGAENIFRASRDAGVSLVINAGSSSEYGTKSHPMREDELITPNSHYAVGKAAQTHLGQYMTSLGLPVVTLRLFSVYGPFEEPGRFVPTVIAHALRGRDISIANPRTARDFIFLNDAIAAFVAAAEKPGLAGEIVNVGTGIQHTLKDVYDVVMKATGSTSKAVYGSYESRSFDTEMWVADVTKMKKLLAIEPRSLAEGIEAMVKWFPSHTHVYEART